MLIGLLIIHAAMGGAYVPLDTFEWELPCASSDSSAARIDNGDGTWSFALDPSFDTTTILSSRAVDWVYDRQQSFPYFAPEPIGPITVTGSQFTSYMDAIYATEMRDHRGRVWRVHYVDEDELASIRAEHRARVEAIYTAAGEDVSVETFSSPPSEPDPWIGEIMEFEPESWSEQCPGANPEGKYRIWDIESRTRLAHQELTLRQQTANLIVSYLPNSPKVRLCTGVQIDSRTTLTAAHCVHDVTCVEVCKFGNSDLYYRSSYAYYIDPNSHPDNPLNLICTRTRYIWEHPDYWRIGAINPDYGDDIAVLRHGSSHATFHAESMALSSANDATLESYSLHNLGHPAHEQYSATQSFSCTLNNVTGNSLDPTQGSRSALYHQIGSVASTPGKRILSYHDGGPGHSGGPLYYCPGGTCSKGEKGLVAGIWGGWSINRRASCKINDKYEWIQAWK